MSLRSNTASTKRPSLPFIEREVEIMPKRRSMGPQKEYIKLTRLNSKPQQIIGQKSTAQRLEPKQRRVSIPSPSDMIPSNTLSSTMIPQNGPTLQKNQYIVPSKAPNYNPISNKTSSDFFSDQVIQKWNQNLQSSSYRKLRSYFTYVGIPMEEVSNLDALQRHSKTLRNTENIASWLTFRRLTASTYKDYAKRIQNFIKILQVPELSVEEMDDLNAKYMSNTSNTLNTSNTSKALVIKKSTCTKITARPGVSVMDELMDDFITDYLSFLEIPSQDYSKTGLMTHKSLLKNTDYLQQYMFPLGGHQEDFIYNIRSLHAFLSYLNMDPFSSSEILELAIQSNYTNPELEEIKDALCEREEAEAEEEKEERMNLDFPDVNDYLRFLGIPEEHWTEEAIKRHDYLGVLREKRWVIAWLNKKTECNARQKEEHVGYVQYLLISFNVPVFTILELEDIFNSFQRYQPVKEKACLGGMVGSRDSEDEVQEDTASNADTNADVDVNGNDVDGVNDLYFANAIYQ